MTLNEWAATKKRAIFEALQRGEEPPEGEWDAATLREGKTKGAVQMGATHYEPHRAQLEFIYPDPLSTATVLLVSLTPPERIVFLPVPPWVIEDVWQGEVQGAYHFESDALEQIRRLEQELSAESNAHWFGRQPAKRRE